MELGKAFGNDSTLSIVIIVTIVGKALSRFDAFV